MMMISIKNIRHSFFSNLKAIAFKVFGICLICLLVSCSTTKNIPEDDKLYIGLKKIEYKNYEKNSQFYEVQDEMEASLAAAPNGALFGSSYYRTPFPYGLWVWNSLSNSKGKFAKWIVKSFGKAPVLLSGVNPELRASVAQSVLRNHGYMHGEVNYNIVDVKNPKKAKIGYQVNFGDLFIVDTLEYVNFPEDADSIINSTLSQAIVKPGSPFDASKLDQERTRIATLFKNNGFYYYQTGYASYLADTLDTPSRARLRLQLADNIPEQAKHEWYIGNITIDLRKQYTDELKDSLEHRFFKVRYKGKRPPIRPRIIVRDLKLRHSQKYNYDNYLTSANKINSTGLFNMVEFNFTPRDTTQMCDTLDLNLSCIFGKPYDFYLETNYKSKINGRMGPELVIGLTKKNAFRGGEKLDINIHGTYEWEIGGKVNGASNMNAYEIGADASIEFPRLVAPVSRSKVFYTTPSTYAKVTFNMLKRPSYFRMYNFIFEWTYKWQLSSSWRHEFSPITLQYQKLSDTSLGFDSIMYENPYLMASMQDVLIPKIRYSITYSSSLKHKSPIVWNATISESSNIISLFYMMAGRKWNQTNKNFLDNAYAQFVKFETDFTKTWQLDLKSQLIGHIAAGVIYAYGNSNAAPYSEQFYVGGANSIRAFATRSIGPGRFKSSSSKYAYLDQTGDIKLQLNLEWRQNLFGNLYGAVFLDAGNVWTIQNDPNREGSQFKLKSFFKEMALGTGIGIRYDLEFLVLRLDWGVGLHVPFKDGKNGFYNISKFKDGQALHFAIGYPF